MAFDPKPTEPEEIDESLDPFASFVAAFAALDAMDPSGSMRLERLTLDLPVEFEVYADEDGRVRFGSSPPTQYIETTVLPVFHLLRLTIEKETDGDALGAPRMARQRRKQNLLSQLSAELGKTPAPIRRIRSLSLR